MLNLGGLQLLLGHPEQAIEHLTTSFALAVEAGSQPDAAQALGSLAAVHEHLGDHEAADEHARKALALLEGREDFLDEIGQSNLVLGRSLLERGRLDEAEQCFRAADAAFEQMSSIAHRTGAWVALGDLAERRGTPARRRGCTETLPKRFGSSASEERRIQVNRARLTFALVNLALVAAWLGQFRRPSFTFSDGD